MAWVPEPAATASTPATVVWAPAPAPPQADRLGKEQALFVQKTRRRARAVEGLLTRRGL
jgi:hypothetical protein